jgi:hypothetical protein
MLLRKMNRQRNVIEGVCEEFAEHGGGGCCRIIDLQRPLFTQQRKRSKKANECHYAMNI